MKNIINKIINKIIKVKYLSATLLALLMLPMTACSQLSPIVPIPEKFEVSDKVLQQKIQAHFPMQRQWLNMYQIKASDPIVILDAPKNRIRIQFEALLDGPLMPAQNGLIDISSMLKVDATGQKLLLDQPLVERVYFKNLPGFIANTIETPLKIAVQNELNQRLIYQLKPEEAKILGVAVHVKKIEVQPAHINIYIEKNKI